MGSRNRNASQNSLDEVSVPHPMSKKWAPYKYLSGMMVYLHQNVVDNEENIGGEFMVSTIVQGSAEQCLSALTQRSSGMSVLGPAAAVDTISCEGDSQVLHIRLSAPSAAATSFSSSSMLAARHAVIQQTRSTDPHGIHTIMFRSLPPQQARQLLQQQQQQFCIYCQQQRQQQQQQWWWTQAVLHACRRIDSMIATVAAGVASYSSSSSRDSSRTAAAAAVGDLLWSPVLVEVAGGYSIANLSSAADHPGGESQESLLTCVIKVNLGGYLWSTTNSSSSSSWMSSWSPKTRLADAFIDQMLSAVAMVKNAVEQQQQQQGPDLEQDHFFRVSHNLAPDTSADNITTSSSSRVQLAASHHHHSSSSRCNASKRQHQSNIQGRQQQQQQQPDLCCCYNTYSNSYRQYESGAMYRIAQKLLQSMTGTAAAARSVHCNVQYNGAGECNDSSSWSGHCSSDYDHHNKQHQHYHRLSQRQQQQQQSSSNKPEPDHQDICSESSADSFRSPRASSTDYGSRSSSSSSSSSDAVTVDHHRHDGILPQQAAATADDLVALDGSGQPLRGTCNPCFWCPLHQPEAPAAPFKVRGSSYLCDHTKVSAGTAAYQLIAVDLVDTPAAVDHIARYLPAVRRSRAAFCFVINMLVPTSQSVMNLVMTFGSTTHWKQTQQQVDSHSSSSSSSSGSGSDMRGFERVLHRFIQGSDAERSNIFKMIPHIEVGPWLLKQAVGSTPVIMGRKLATRYHLTDRYIEVDIDVTTCKTAGYIVQSIKGMTSSLVVDLCYLLEGQRPEELPEVLIGAVRFSNIDMSATTPLDMSQEVPCWPQPWR